MVIQGWRVSQSRAGLTFYQTSDASWTQLRGRGAVEVRLGWKVANSKPLISALIMGPFSEQSFCLYLVLYGSALQMQLASDSFEEKLPPSSH